LEPDLVDTSGGSSDAATVMFVASMTVASMTVASMTVASMTVASLFSHDIVPSISRSSKRGIASGRLECLSMYSMTTQSAMTAGF
jgi:hypothetical protein